MHEPHQPVLARTLRGIESVARDEVRTYVGVEAVEVGHRELRFRAPLTPALLELGSVDDVFVIAGEVEAVTRRRESLARLASVAVELAGLAAAGSDVDPAAVQAARRNAASAGVDVPFSLADAATLDDIDCVVTNPPWGRAVRSTGFVVPRARRIVLLSAERPNLRDVVHQQKVRVHGARATISVVERG